MRCVTLTTLSAVCFSLLTLSGCNRGYGKKLEFNGGEVYYTSAVEQAEAQKLGEYLDRTKFFDGTPKSVQLDKKDGKYLFRMVVKEGYESNPNYDTIFRAFAADMTRDALGGAAMEMHLCDNRFKTLKVLNPYPTVFYKAGKVHYTESVDKETADKLGQSLSKQSFFDENPKSVVLDKTGENYTVKIAVKDGADKNELFLAGFRAMRTELAANILKNPGLEVQLCDQQMNTLKVLDK